MGWHTVKIKQKKSVAIFQTILELWQTNRQKCIQYCKILLELGIVKTLLYAIPLKEYAYFIGYILTSSIDQQNVMHTINVSSVIAIERLLGLRLSSVLSVVNLDSTAHFLIVT